jgi:hypothetical protein
MVIRLSPTLEKRVARAAKAKGIRPDRLVRVALSQYLAPKRNPRAQVSEARLRLRQLARYKKPVTDFDAEVHAARQYARQLEEENAEFIEAAAGRFAGPESNGSK